VVLRGNLKPRDVRERQKLKVKRDQDFEGKEYDQAAQERDFDLVRRGIGTLAAVVVEVEAEDHGMKGLDFLVVEDVVLEVDLVEVAEGYHLLELIVGEAEVVEE
jgi:hypothetical protein